MEWTFSRAGNASKPGTAFTSFSHAVRLSPTKGVITRNGIYTIGEHGPTRLPRRPRGRDYEILNKAFIELSEESDAVKKERDHYHKQLLSLKEQYLSLSSDHQQLKEKYEQLQHLEEWGQIIRGKDEELRRLHEYIRKMSFDRTHALNHKTVADVTIDELKSKLRKKDKEVKDIKAQEKVQIKAKVLGETEKLRNERDLALANLYRQEQLAEKYRIEVGQIQKISEERKMVIQEIQKKITSKEKHIEELRKQLIMARLFNK